MHATTNTTTTAYYSSTTTITIFPTTTSSAATCKAKNTTMKISRSIWIYRLSKRHIDNVIAMVNSFKLSTNTTTATTITIIS